MGVGCGKEKDESVNELLMEVFVEQPLALPESANYLNLTKDYLILDEASLKLFNRLGEVGAVLKTPL